MLFNELDKIKRSAVMTTIVLIFVGNILLVIPESYIPVIGGALGYGLLVTACMVLFHFIASQKSLIHYIELTIGLFSGLLGITIFVFDNLILQMLSLLVGIIPILLGVYGILHALVFARKSGRKGWWILIVLAVVLMALGVLIFLNPWWDSPALLTKIIGGALLFSAFASALRLIWVWPFKNGKESAEDASER